MPAPSRPRRHSASPGTTSSYAIARANITTDVRGQRIRFGFGCYHTADEIEAAVAAIARAIT